MAIAGLLSVLLLGELGAAPPTGKRARRPEFPPSVSEAFFPDARERLKGERPGPRDAEAGGADPTVAAAVPGPANGTWSHAISAAVLEDEIKARVPKLVVAVENATRFKSGDYQTARRELGLLAALMGIVAEYDGSIRWKSEAAALRDLLGRASHHCKVASDTALADARARAEDLQLVIRGGSPRLEAVAGKRNWPQIADRTLLMQRLEAAQQQAIMPGVANEKTFAADPTTLHHEAEIVAAIGEIITQDGYEFADDETYLEYAKAMQQHALSLRNAALDADYGRSRKAASALGQSCANCHEGYRG